ncbi:MAG: hypothetical protein K8Q99_01120 [Acholeplasmataceae bacterium]|nr:hypothetical protein [Acholeplasmataceae bacterium]
MDKSVNKIKELTGNLSVKQNEKLHINSLLSLFEKIANIKDEELEKITAQIADSLETVNESSFDVSNYKKSFEFLRRYVKQKHGFIAKGELIGQAMAIGSGLGVAIGAGLMTINTICLAIGIPIGISIGVTIGALQEQKAKEKGLLY